MDILSHISPNQRPDFQNEQGHRLHPRQPRLPERPADPRQAIREPTFQHLPKERRAIKPAAHLLSKPGHHEPNRRANTAKPSEPNQERRGKQHQGRLKEGNKKQLEQQQRLAAPKTQHLQQSLIQRDSVSSTWKPIQLE